VLRRAAFVLLYAAGRLGEAAGAVLHYAAAGTLSLADLRAGTVARWSAFGAMESEGHRDSGLMQWERTLYLAALKPGERVLSVGCGTGRDVIALLRAGYQVDGIDTAADCVEAARRAVATRGLVAWLAPGALETVTLPARYDGIIFSWYCYSYIPGAAARIGALRHAREALTDGGRVLISYLSIGNSRRYPLIAITRAVARLTGSDWRAERGDVVLLSSPRRRRVHYEHHFAPSELEAEARAAGLRVALHDVPDDGHVVLVRE
jgi:SAM-dependent methyltransferase